MKRINVIHIFIIVLLYISVLLITKNYIFSYRFDKSLIKRYFLSQDIPHEVQGKRLFLSDGEIYLTTGYLYTKGYDPSSLNFEHPPLIKYLFGVSLILFQNPYIAQIVLGVFFLYMVYLLCLKIYKSPLISFFSCVLLIVDPLFIDISSQPLLDLGQSGLLLLYLISMLFYKNSILLQGISLGLFAGTKFWVTPLFFVGIIFLYKIYKKEFQLKSFLLHMFIALITYSLLYTKTFIQRDGNFNIIFFILKTFKYRINHNIASIPGASLILFLSGYFKSWWGNYAIIRSNIWSIFWPIIFILSSKEIIKIIVNKKTISLKNLTCIIPIVYLLFLGVEAPFTRYFLIILPFFYYNFSEFLITWFRKNWT